MVLAKLKAGAENQADPFTGAHRPDDEDHPLTATTTRRASTARTPAAAENALALPDRPRRTRKKKTDPGERLRDAVIDKLEGMKARDLRMIDVRGQTSITDYLVIASGTSNRHVKSMADEVAVAAKQLDNPPIGVEGEREGEWVLVDLGDVVVHLMLPRTREFYGLERMWGVDVPVAADPAQLAIGAVSS
jgi:ribosome silencing factor RsfS/YbeB/iojap